MMNLILVKVAREARQAFQTSDDAWNEMNNMFGDHDMVFSSAYDAANDRWSTSFERGMQLEAALKGYFRSLKWRAA